MFEKYHLVHFEVTSPISHASQERIEAHVKGGKALEGSRFQASPAGADIGEPVSEAAYRITGSFDYLLPSVRKEETGEGQTGQLFLQSFCVMDSSWDYYTRREGYDSLLVSYTYAGEGSLTYGEESYELKAGTGFVIDCRKRHEYRCGKEHWQHVDIHIWGVQAEEFCRFFERLGTVFFSFSEGAMNGLIEKVLECYTAPSELRTLYVGNALSDLLCEILKKAEREGRSGIPRIYQEMVKDMETRYMFPLSLEELGEKYHLSRYHLCREFKRYIGYAPGEYLIMLRLEHAFILLAESDLTIEQVAAQSGFVNMSNFIGQVKKRTGMTPSAFRKMSRGL